jgi:hypothetical protein
MEGLIHTHASQKILVIILSETKIMRNYYLHLSEQKSLPVLLKLTPSVGNHRIVKNQGRSVYLNAFIRIMQPPDSYRQRNPVKISPVIRHCFTGKCLPFKYNKLIGQVCRREVVTEEILCTFCFSRAAKVNYRRDKLIKFKQAIACLFACFSLFLYAGSQ